MKRKEYEYNNGHKISYFVHGAADLFLTPVQRFYKGKRTVIDLAEALKIPKTDKQRNRRARNKAGKIFQDCMQMMGNDMIDDHTIFTLPMPNAGWVYISDLNSVQKPEKLFYIIPLKGKFWTPMIHRGTRMNMTGAYLYTIRFNRTLRKKLLDKVMKGERYIA